MKDYLSLVKFSHTIFALPFALLGFFLGVKWYGDELTWMTLVKVVACMVFARNAAMAFNRYVDRDIDALNPRTNQREIPAGVISSRRARTFIIVNCLLFIVTTYFINPLCFYLSPVALAVVLGYSYTKHYTALCHLILGLGLALAPVGAYLAVSGAFHWIPIIYGLVVLTWVSGFDIIYALQDIDFDKGQNLRSLPVRFGQQGALHISTALHVCCALLMILAGWLAQQDYSALSILHWIGALLFIALLVYQHLLVKPGRLDKVNLAFFTTNGIGSLVFCLFFIVDLLW
ncbi:MAG: UbiA family prenyltransferase [Saprospiraceae bacterium]|nr:UbiA family prenyltransferase [Saprospiraceae bacterium]